MEGTIEELENMILALSRSVQKLSYAIGAEVAVNDIALQILLAERRPDAEFCASLRHEVETFLDTRNQTFDPEIDAAIAHAMNIRLEAAGEPPPLFSHANVLH